MDKPINRPPVSKRGRKVVIGIIIFLLALSAIPTIYSIFVPKTCHTAECFFAAANDCRKAKLELVDDANILWNFSVEAFCGGFKKTLVFLDEKEIADMKKLLEGKSLSCDYKQGNFDKRWLTSLIFGLENCQGELKEAVGQLLFISQ